MNASAGSAAARGELLALATATARVLGDRHYVSDVIAGGASGFAIGFGLPTLLHYRTLMPTARIGTGAPARRHDPDEPVGGFGLTAVGTM